MSDPPSKRRKTSPTAAAPIIDATAAGEARTSSHPLRSPVTHRQSFQSPTKSSLARSNPEVLSHVLARSPTRSPQRQQPPSRSQQQQQRPSSSSRGSLDRTFGLRDRKALRPSLIANAESSPSRALSQSPPKKIGPIAAQQQQVFAAPPRRISRTVESPISRPSEIGRGGKQSTPVQRSDPDDQLASELDSATRELETSGLLASSAFPDNSLEPDLPPTPTQLGREMLIKASRDLLSSPSAGRRLRKDLLSKSAPRNTDITPTAEIPEEDLDDPAVQKRNDLQKDLLAQLDQLKADVAQLENWTSRAKRGFDNQPPDQDAVSNLISLLASTNKSSDRQTDSSASEPTPISTLISSLLPFSAKAVPTDTHSTSPEPINAFALNNIPDPKPYITAFAPLTLEYSTSLSSSTSSTNPESAITETHEIVLSAPSPFAANLFRIPLQFTTELQSQRIVSISLSKRRPSLPTTRAKIPPNLQAWIESRTSNPILGLDVSGLCFGISQFWEASVCRARIWSRLRKTQEILLAKGPKKRKLGEISAESLSGAFKKSDTRFIVPHLQRSSMLFSSSPDTPFGNKDREPKLLLSCALTLDQWTSEARLTPDISVSIADLSESKRNKAELELKRLFHSILREEKFQGRRSSGSGSKGSESMSTSTTTSVNEERQAQAIVKAVEGIMGVLFGLDVL